MNLEQNTFVLDTHMICLLFFRMVMNELNESRFFEGPECEKYFSHDLDLLEKQHYKVVGRLVGLSLAQEGPGIHFLSHKLFDLMVGKETDLTDVESLLPLELNACIKQVNTIKKYNTMYTFVIPANFQNRRGILFGRCPSEICFRAVSQLLMTGFQ